MAVIQTINVSTPNDGLGDPLRTSQIKANENFAELNAKKVEVIPDYGLSQNDFTDEYREKLDNLPESFEQVQANWNQNDPDEPDYIIGKPQNSKTITTGSYTLIDNILTILPGWVWQIGNGFFSNVSNIEIIFPYASTDNSRFDIVAFNTLNSAVRVEGVESETNPFIPILPDNTCLFGIFLISDGSVSFTPTEVKQGWVTDQAVSGSLTNPTLIGVVIDCITADGSSILGAKITDYMPTFSHNATTGEVTGLTSYPDSLIMFHYSKIS